MKKFRSWNSVVPATALTSLALLICSAGVARAQDLIPGAYTPAPVGFNVVTMAAVVNTGAIAFDPSLPVDDAHATVGAWAIAFGRTLNVGGRFANFGVSVPVLFGNVSGLVLNQFQEVSRKGAGDMTARFAINVYGGPARTLQQFGGQRSATVAGLGLTVGVPVGQYESSRYINLGTNRWSFRPELGISRTRGKWTFEGDIGGTFFTDNANFVNGARREQSPILGLQGHLIRAFRPGLWIAADGNFWKGGLVTTGGVPGAEEQQNSRLGLTLAVPVRRHQVRLSYSFGAYTTVGGDFHSVGVSYSYAWAGRP